MNSSELTHFNSAIGLPQQILTQRTLGIHGQRYRSGNSAQFTLSAVEAGVQIGGTARKPVVRLISDPELPDAEKLPANLFTQTNKYR